MTQNEYILIQLPHGPMTAKKAIKACIYRLASRISDLRKLGYDIKDRWKKVRTRWGCGRTMIKEYYLEAN